MANIKFGTREQFNVLKEDTTSYKYNDVAAIYGTKIFNCYVKNYCVEDDPMYIIFTPYYDFNLYFITDSEYNELYDPSVLSDLYDRFYAVGSQRKFHAFPEDPNYINSMWYGYWYVKSEYELNKDSILAYAASAVVEAQVYRNGYLPEEASYEFAKMFRVLKACSEYKAK